jgi:hypothetical protein
LDADGAAGFAKGNSAVEGVGVSQGQVIEAVGGGPPGQVLDRSDSAQEGIVRMHVEVGEVSRDAGAHKLKS